MNKWKQIWENRDTSFAQNNDENILMKLIQCDGFDGGGGDSCITTVSWLSYISRIKSELFAHETDSIFEVGCGCGAILYPLHKAGHKVGGLDYSETLVKKAQAVLSDADLVVCDASLLEVLPQYDFVIANSMFFYFPNLNYASLVLEKMYEKAKKGIAVLDVPDARLESILERKKRDACFNYDEKYKGLNHLYYHKAWFLDFAKQKQCSKITISQQDIKGYGYNGFRFNCFMIK
jgi:2-polyprenyl-3-methyl-5-hydroxy-6-metoxy-1,4-benzoquinol methylase